MRILVELHCSFMDLERMNWIYEHTEVLTLGTLIFMTVGIVATMLLLASGEMPEATELQGAPETLGDFPPFTEEEIATIRKQFEAEEKTK